MAPARAWSHSSKPKSLLKICIASLLIRDAAHAYWEAIQPAAVDFPHAWATRVPRPMWVGALVILKMLGTYALVKSTDLFFLGFDPHTSQVDTC